MAIFKGTRNGKPNKGYRGVRVLSPYGPVGGAPLTINARKKSKKAKAVPLDQLGVREISLTAPQVGRNKGVGQCAWAYEMRRLPCHYCGGPGGTVDHIIPRSHGGRPVFENCVPACERCNNLRGSFKYEHFLAAVDYGMLDALYGSPNANRKRVAYWIMSALRVRGQRSEVVA